MQQENTIHELTYEQIQHVSGGSTSTSTCTKTSTTICNRRGTRCVTASIEVCTEVKKP